MIYDRALLERAATLLDECNAAAQRTHQVDPSLGVSENPSKVAEDLRAAAGRNDADMARLEYEARAATRSCLSVLNYVRKIGGGRPYRLRRDSECGGVLATGWLESLNSRMLYLEDRPSSTAAIPVEVRRSGVGEGGGESSHKSVESGDIERDLLALAEYLPDIPALLREMAARSSDNEAEND